MGAISHELCNVFGWDQYQIGLSQVESAAMVKPLKLVKVKPAIAQIDWEKRRLAKSFPFENFHLFIDMARDHAENHFKAISAGLGHGMH